jgi:hypothetical protein
MKQLYTLLTAVLLTASAFLPQQASAQAPEKMSFQAVVRDAGNSLVTGQTVRMQLSILQGSFTGTAVYVETQSPTTNMNGLISISVGTGEAISGDFTTIDWSNGPYFIKTETDPTGGTNFTISGTSQLMSVPYALHANTADSIAGGVSFTEVDGSVTNEIQTISRTGTTVTLSNGGGKFTDSVNTYTAGTGIDINNNVISTSDICGLSIGDTYQGGTIFYLDASGCHGLISAPYNQSNGIRWHAGTNGVTRATGDGLYAGEVNTAIIIASQVSIGDDGSDYAAQICNDLQITEGGVTYGDWYLPSKYELNLLYLQKTVVGGFATFYYWSSTEYDGTNAWGQDFDRGAQNLGNKFTTNYVRAVRAF